MWGGAACPIIPVEADGTIPEIYLSALRGSHVEHILSFHGGRSNLFDAVPKRNSPSDLPEYGAQFAFAMLPYRASDKPIVRTPRLDENDPWKPCYAATLGMLPDHPNQAILKSTQIESHVSFVDFANLETPDTSGSYTDLKDSLVRPPRAWTPRMASMAKLPYGIVGSSSLRSSGPVLPNLPPPIIDAGPNIVVAFGDDPFADAVYLWNLRARCGDSLAVPIGVPIESVQSVVNDLMESPDISRNGSGVRLLYVTSMSVDIDSLSQQLAGIPHVGAATPESLLSFCPSPGWRRQELTTFKDGVGSYIPVPAHSEINNILSGPGVTPYLRLSVEVSVLNYPFPSIQDTSLENPLSMSSFAGGTSSVWLGVQNITTPRRVTWPSNWSAVQALANLYGLEPSASTPGRAAMSLIEGSGGLFDFTSICDHKVLEFLDVMASSTGFGYFKKKLRNRGEPEPDPQEGFARTVSELREFTADKLRDTLGGNDATTAWLDWAINAELVTQGFEISCTGCQGRFWIPLSAFSPPVPCPSCGMKLDRPFGNATNVVFRYKLSERLRRVYEHDSIGHILAARFFASILDQMLIGVHPGVEFRQRGTGQVVGEADVLLLTVHGELIPVEVKRSFRGFKDSDATKLDDLATALRSPWSAVVVCDDVSAIPPEFVEQVVERHPDGSYKRMLLTLEHLTKIIPVWLLAADPFALDALEVSEPPPPDGMHNLQSYLQRHSSHEGESQRLAPPRGFEELRKSLNSRDLNVEN